MAAAVSVVRWLINEGTSTTIGDDTSNGNTGTLDESSGDAEWESPPISAGEGVDFTATIATAGTAIIELADISNNGNIGSSFPSGTQELSFLLVCDIDAGDNSAPRLLQIGTDAGDGDLALGTRPSDFLFRWSKESGGSDVVYPVPSGGYGTGVVVIAGLVNTTEGTAADRIKLYYNNSLQTADSGTITLNESVDLDNSLYNLSLGNRGSLNRNIDGKVYYFELFTGTLTTQQVEDSYDALILDNDADWAVAPTGRIMGGLANLGGLAGMGGIAGRGGGSAG